MSTEDLCKKAQAQMAELCREFSPMYFTPEERIYIDAQHLHNQGEEEAKEIGYAIMNKKPDNQG